VMRFATDDEAIVDRFMGYRSQSWRPADDAFRRLLARAWNSNVGNIPGWPARHKSRSKTRANCSDVASLTSSPQSSSPQF